MSASAGPWVIFGPSNRTRANRIPLDIADCCPGMSLIQHARERASLPDVSGLAVLFIELGSIDTVTVSEYARNGVFSFRYADNVDVVGQHTIRRDSLSKSWGVVSQQL